MSTKRDNLMNRESCLNRAAPEEPIFVLRAHDKNAPDTVREWAELYAARKNGVAKMIERELAKYNEALDCANKMENWLRLHREP